MFLGQGNSLVRSFISDLFQHHVATLDFSREVTPRSFRPYQPSIELERTLSIMREGRGTEFEPGLFDNFVGILS